MFLVVLNEILHTGLKLLLLQSVGLLELFDLLLHIQDGISGIGLGFQSRESVVHKVGDVVLTVLHGFDVDVVDRLFEFQERHLGVDKFLFKLAILFFKFIQFATQTEIVIK